MWVASFFHILHVHRQRRAPCDQYCRDTIDSPPTKHTVLTKLNYYNILMSDIDRNTIRMFQDRVCSRYQHVFTYWRRSLRQNRTLLIIKSRYLMDMSPLYHVVGYYDIPLYFTYLSSLHHNGNVTHTLTSDLKIYVSRNFCILSGRIVNFRYCKNE